MSSSPPRPYRFKSTTLNFQVPGLKTLPNIIQNTKFIQNMSDTEAWKTAMKIFRMIRTWSRRTIWGDRLFLQFEGPASILVQSRGARINDILSEREVNEIADSPRGLTTTGAASKQPQQSEEQLREKTEEALHAAPVPARSLEDLNQEVRGIDHRIANLTNEGKVIFEKPDQRK